MKLTRTKFKNALAFCKKNKMEILKNKLVAKFKSKDKVNFWCEMRKINGKQSSYNSSCIDNKTDTHDIISLFNEKYSAVLNDPLSQVPIVNETDSGSSMMHQCDPNLLISRRRIDTAINLLKTGLSQDDIHSNHIKYSGIGFRNLLRRFFTMCLTHNFLPDSMLLGEIRPRPKNNIASKKEGVVWIRSLC